MLYTEDMVHMTIQQCVPSLLYNTLEAAT